MFLVHILAILRAYLHAYFTVFKCITIRSLLMTNNEWITWLRFPYLVGRKVPLHDQPLSALELLRELPDGIQGWSTCSRRKCTLQKNTVCASNSDLLTLTCWIGFGFELIFANNPASAFYNLSSSPCYTLCVTRHNFKHLIIPQVNFFIKSLILLNFFGHHRGILNLTRI